MAADVTDRSVCPLVMLSLPRNACQELSNHQELRTTILRQFLGDDSSSTNFWAARITRHSRPLKLQICAWPRRCDRALGSGCGQQCCCGSVEVFPRRLGQIRLRADEVANHLPSRQVQSAFRGRSHGERYCALRAKTNSSRRRLLARTNPSRLREQKYSDRFFAHLKFPITAKAILTIQLLSLRLACLSVATGTRQASSVPYFLECFDGRASMQRDSRLGADSRSVAADATR